MKVYLDGQVALDDHVLGKQPGQFHLGESGQSQQQGGGKGAERSA